jgi:hypothetical protein
MSFYMFVHKISSDGVSPGDMVGALKFDRGSTSVTGTKKMIDTYTNMLGSDAWSRAQRSDGNPFSTMFGSSMVPRYIFSEGDEGEKVYSDFMKASSSLRTEVMK